MKGIYRWRYRETKKEKGFTHIWYIYIRVYFLIKDLYMLYRMNLKILFSYMYGLYDAAVRKSIVDIPAVYASIWNGSNGSGGSTLLKNRPIIQKTAYV